MLCDALFFQCDLRPIAYLSTMHRNAGCYILIQLCRVGYTGSYDCDHRMPFAHATRSRYQSEEVAYMLEVLGARIIVARIYKQPKGSSKACLK
jgi:hypothetical protein